MMCVAAYVLAGLESLILDWVAGHDEHFEEVCTARLRLSCTMTPVDGSRPAQVDLLGIRERTQGRGKVAAYHLLDIHMTSRATELWVHLHTPALYDNT